MKKVLVLCTGNSCRSQMAEGYLKLFAGSQGEIYSAGIEAHGLNPLAVESMNEDGIDISHNISDTIDKYREVNFDFIITVCDNAKENCPWFPSNAKRFHHDFPDPAKAVGTQVEIMNQFHLVRNQIKEYCRNWVKDNLTAV